jgi:hypothetical protein
MTWTSAPSGMPVTTQTIEDIAFVDSLHGFLTQSGILYATDDGGTTWNQRTYSGTLFQLDIEPIPNSITLISTGSSTVSGFGSSFSQDLGYTWTLIDTAISHTGVDFLNESTGWSGEVASGTGTGGAYLYNGTPLAVTSLKDVSESFKAYPNPSSGKVILSMANCGDEITVRVYNYIDQEIFSKKYSNLHDILLREIDLSDFEKGMVNILIDGDKVHTTRQVILY